MRGTSALVVAVTLLAGACSDGNKDSTTSASTPTSDTVVSTPVDVTDACALLSAADFAAVGVTLDAEGVDVSENFTLATTSSVACQWTNFDNTMTTLELGDEAYLEDKVSSFDSADHDFEAGVRIGDTYFTMSTTDDHGAEAITALATLVADRLSA